ncbi:MAG TPA: hypothetical protein VFG23_23990 [Polyangia bacterium]|nr:hypothetical protein [Polyangia bacterium]
MRGLSLLGIAVGLAALISLSTGRAAAEGTPNKCGCYKDSAGTCFCAKKGKCGCPGDCEPKGCEEQRDKEIQKEIDAETKKAEASQNKRSAGDQDGDNGDNGAKAEREPARPARAARPKLSPAQAKQLAKLIDLYLVDHPDARGKAIEDVRSDMR